MKAEEILEAKFKEAGINKGWVSESKQAVLNAMNEFAEHRNKELIEERKSHAISFAVYYDFNDFNDTDTVGYLYNEWIKTNKT